MLEVSFFESVNYISIIVLNNFLRKLLNYFLYHIDTKNNNEKPKQTLLLTCDFIKIVGIAPSLKLLLNYT